MLKINLFTNIKKLESSTLIYFNKKENNEKSLSINFEDTLGQYLFVINEEYKNYYIKKHTKINMFSSYTTCLPYLEYIENKDLWKRNISDITKLILNIKDDPIWKP